MSLKRSRFTECFVHENALGNRNFEAWVFCSGMLFNAPNKWWGDQGQRDNPHEGLDLCIYRTRQHGLYRLDEKTKIPALYDGVIIRIVNDFLGRTLIMEHNVLDGADGRLLSIYGHINPCAGLQVGSIVKEGRIIATLADPGTPKADIVPHLHISLGWISKDMSYEKLDWKSISDPNTLTLLDPLLALPAHYLTPETALLPCQDLRKLASSDNKLVDSPF